MFSVILYGAGMAVAIVIVANIAAELRRIRIVMGKIQRSASAIAVQVTAVAKCSGAISDKLASIDEAALMIVTTAQETTDYIQAIAKAVTLGSLNSNIAHIAESAHRLPAAIETALENMKSWSESLDSSNVMNDVQEFMRESDAPNIVASFIYKTQEALEGEAEMAGYKEQAAIWGNKPYTALNSD